MNIRKLSLPLFILAATSVDAFAQTQWVPRWRYQDSLPAEFCSRIPNQGEPCTVQPGYQCMVSGQIWACNLVNGAVVAQFKRFIPGDRCPSGTGTGSRCTFAGSECYTSQTIYKCELVEEPIPPPTPSPTPTPTRTPEPIRGCVSNGVTYPFGHQYCYADFRYQLCQTDGNWSPLGGPTQGICGYARPTPTPTPPPPSGCESGGVLYPVGHNYCYQDATYQTCRADNRWSPVGGPTEGVCGYRRPTPTPTPTVTPPPPQGCFADGELYRVGQRYCYNDYRYQTCRVDGQWSQVFEPTVGICGYVTPTPTPTARPTQPPTGTVKFITTNRTFFKRTTAQSSSLPNQSKCEIEPGRTVEARVLSTVGNHVELQLTKALPNCMTYGRRGDVGYIFSTHMQQQ